MFKRSWKKLLAGLAILGFVLLLLSPIVAKADTAEDTFESATALLAKYSLVQGDERGYRFGDNISRAELAKLLVVAVGMEPQLKEFMGRRAFSDTQGYWAEAHIAMVKQLGLMRGYPQGDFRPLNPVSYAEVITVFARLVGLEASKDPWPNTYVVPARNAGMIPDTMKSAQNLDGAAIRGDVFVLLKRTMVDLRNFAGQTLLQRFHDRTPPKLVIDTQAEETSAAHMTLVGSVLDGDRLRINGESVPLDFGRFLHPMDLRMGPNTVRIQAWDAAGNMAEKVITITRVEGTGATIDFAGPARVVAGQTAQYSLVVRDQNGEEVTDLSRAEVTVTGEIGTFDIATATFTAGAKAGQGTITVSVGGVNQSVPISVVAGTLSRLGVLPENVSLAPGEKQTFTVSGYDAHGNPLPVTGVTWSASGGTVDAQGVFTAGEGTAAMTVTASAAGRRATLTIQRPNYKVAKVVLVAPKTPTVANGKSEVVLTATLQDAAGATVTDYKGDLTVSSSASNTAVPVLTSAPVVDGVAQITVRAGNTPGTASIRVSTNLGKTASAEVKVDPQVIQSIRTTVTPAPGPDGSTMGTLELVALDRDNNPILAPLSQTIIVKLSITPDTGGRFVLNNQATTDLPIGPLDPATGDVRSRTQVTFTPQSGTLVITGVARPTAFAYVKVQDGTLAAGPVGTPKQVRMEPIPETIAGLQRMMYVTVVDENGYRVTTNLTGYNVELRDQNGVYWTPATSLSAGAGRAMFQVTQNRAGTYTYTAYLTPGGHSVSYTTTVVPATVAGVRLTATPATIPADNTSTATLKAELVDAQGNRVTSGTYPVTFTKTTNLSGTQPMAPQVVNSVGGIAELSVRAASTAGVVEQYQASVPGVGPATSPGTITSPLADVSVQGVPYRLDIAFGDNNGNSVEGEPGDNQGIAGRTFNVIVRLLDRLGNPVTWDNSRQVTLSVRNVVTLVPSSYTASVSAGVARFAVNRSDAGTMALKAESDGLLQAITAGYGGAGTDAVLVPGELMAFKVVPDLTSLKTGGSYSLVSVHLVDGSGNLVTNSTGKPFFVNLVRMQTSDAYGYFTVEENASGTRVDRRDVVIPPGAATSAPVRYFSGTDTGTVSIEGTAQDNGKQTATITLVPGGTANALRFEQIPAVTWEPLIAADSVVTGQTVTVTVLDANQKRVTDYGLSGQTIAVSTLNDARVVSVFDPTLRAWRTLDQTLGDGKGDYPQTAVQVPVDRGQAMFRVRAATPGHKAYQASFGGTTGLVSAAGRLDSAAPDFITVQAVRRQATGGGDQVAVEARVRDLYGNTLTWVTGPIEFALSAGAPGTLTSTRAELINGVATVYFQSNLNVAATTDVTISAWSASLRKADGTTPMSPGSSTSPATDALRVLATPELQAVAATNGGGTAGTVEENDEISFTFSEALSTTLASGLTYNGGYVPVTASAQFDAATSTIHFQGAVEGLGSIHLKSGTITTSNAYTVKQIKLDAAGTTLTLRLGQKTVPATPNTQISGDWSTALATFTMNGAIRDRNNSGAHGPFARTPSGNF